MNVDNHAQQPPQSGKLMRVCRLAGSAFEFLGYWGLQYFTLRSDRAVRKYQYRKLKALIEHAWNKVPFYRRYWQDAGFNPSMFKTLDDMRLIPVIDKNTVIANREQMLAEGVPMSRLEVITTGGTTGMPMEFYIDNYHARAKEQGHQMYAAWHMWNYRQFVDKCIALRGARIDDKMIEGGVFWKQSDRDRGIVMSSFHLLEQNYQIYIDKIREYRPRFIRAYPSSIVALCLLMQKHGDGRLPGLKGVLCSSENIFDWQRKLVREVLGVEIHSSYGHSEKAVWAFEKDGQLLFPPRYGYAEFVDENMNPVTQPGKKAEIIATGFNLDAFPFIRYRTEDIAVVGTGVPGYPQTAERILGRNQDFLIDRHGNRVLFTCSDEIFWGMHDITAYQYVQDRPGHFTINIEITPEYDASHTQDILANARSIFVNFDIDVAVVDNIPRTKAGKFKYLIQNIRIDK